MPNIPAAVLAAIALAGAAPAAAQSVPDNVVRAELRPGWTTPDGTRIAALHLVLAPGWKTYWRSPGDAGIPPEFDWKGSRNLGSVTFRWPRPEIFELNGYRTLGYRDKLVLPIEFRPATPGQPMRASAHVSLGVCEEICVPVTVDVAADLSGPGASDPAIRRALDATPGDARAAGLSAAHCTVEPIRDGLKLSAALTLPSLGGGEMPVIEVEGSPIWVSQATARRKGSVLNAEADLVPSDGKPFALDLSRVRITVFAEGGRAVELQGCDRG
ncbi:protein-disulfide reductase DsbD domain-containing protein [Albidovulum sp.]|uniref:protein-disulfide reductase DsbD domain-containing protein n=1 Tax=Albidovulum sp. TaxID=1872424 RepID=UPI003529D255